MSDVFGGECPCILCAASGGELGDWDLADDWDWAARSMQDETLTEQAQNLLDHECGGLVLTEAGQQALAGGDGSGGAR